MSFKEYLSRVTLAIGFTFLINTLIFGQSKMERPIYLDPSQPVDKRVEDLLERM